MLACGALNHIFCAYYFQTHSNAFLMSNAHVFWTNLFLCLSRYYLSDVCQHLTPCLYGFVRICVFLPDMTHTMSQFLFPLPP